MGDSQLQLADPDVALPFLEWLPAYPEPAEWSLFGRQHPWVAADQLHRVVLRLLRSGVIVNGHHPGASELATHVRWPRPRPPTAPRRDTARNCHQPPTGP